MAAIAVLIQAGGALRGNHIVFPELKEIAEALIRLLRSGKTYTCIGTTFLHLLEALGISLAAGTVIGIGKGFQTACVRD